MEVMGGRRCGKATAAEAELQALLDAGHVVYRSSVDGMVRMKRYRHLTSITTLIPPSPAPPPLEAHDVLAHWSGVWPW